MTKETELLHLMRIDGIESCTITEGLRKLGKISRKQLDDECGDISFFQRLAYLYLIPSCQDGILADSEIDNIRTSIKYVFNNAGIEEDVNNTINIALEMATSPASFLLEDTITIFKKYLSKSALKGIVSDCYFISDADGLADEEATFITNLYSKLLG